MKIALAQMEVIPGRPEKNLESMLRNIDEAKKNKVDLIAFPEMCIGGYLLGDKWLDDDYCKNLMEYNEIIREASHGIAIAFGNVYLDDKINERTGDESCHPNKDGRTRKYNAVYVVQDGEYARRANETADEASILPAGTQPKTLLPNYRFFDDERYFFSLQDIAKDFGKNLDELTQPFMIKIDGKEVPVGFELCEDLWCKDYRQNMEAVNATKSLINKGSQFIINLSSSPWTYGKNSARDKRVNFLKEESGESFVPFFYVNCTGAQNNGKNIITFDGGSTVYNEKGQPVILSKEPYAEELIIIEDAHLDKNLPPVERKEEPKIAQKYRAIINGIRHLKNTFGGEEQPRYVIGLSGGIDSLVVAALLVQAAGKDKVLAVNMPYIYNSEKTKRTAMQGAKSLGIEYISVPIHTLVEANESIFEEIFTDDAAKLTSLQKENIQAKIRGTSVLSNLAAKRNAIFTNNGNKLEIAFGYATLYGDVGGAIAPIGDLTKTEVVELAKYLNQEVFKKEVIPEILIPDSLFRFRSDQIQPSAELKDNQVDPMKFGYHCALVEALTDYQKKSPEEIMKWYLAGTLEKNLKISTELIKRWNIQEPEEFVSDLEWVVRNIDRNVFKRVQSPPIIITSKSSYGYDIRESMLPHKNSKEFERLKEKILSMEKYVTRQ